MGIPSAPTPVLPLMAAFSRYPEALTWAQEKCEAVWGKNELISPHYEFLETPYYDSTMGAGLKKMFWTPGLLRSPEELVHWKLISGDWEAEYAQLGRHDESRPLNLDPGYITEAKLILASTKDHAHRLYLAQGIYAEVTLFYKHRKWQARDWTFPDYQREDYQAFFTRCRNYLRTQL